MLKKSSFFKSCLCYFFYSLTSPAASLLGVKTATTDVKKTIHNLNPLINLLQFETKTQNLSSTLTLKSTFI